MRGTILIATACLLSIPTVGALAAPGEQGETPELLVLEPLAADLAAEEPGAGADGTYTMTCEGRITNVFGGTQTCNKSVNTGYFWGSLRIKITPTWSSLASGAMTFKLGDGFGTYYAGACAAGRPALFTSDVHCDGGLVRSTVLWGTHSLGTSTTYNVCGWSLLGCPWKVVAELTTS